VPAPSSLAGLADALSELPPLLTARELAAALRLRTVRALRQYTERPDFPKPVWLTQCTRRFVRDEVVAWLARNATRKVPPAMRRLAEHNRRRARAGRAAAKS
jgi:predicted DNA-binding transcriptional regulator AlpA